MGVHSLQLYNAKLACLLKCFVRRFLFHAARDAMRQVLTDIGLLSRPQRACCDSGGVIAVVLGIWHQSQDGRLAFVTKASPTPLYFATFVRQRLRTLI